MSHESIGQSDRAGAAPASPGALRYFVVDAFTERRFSGNPAAVVPLLGWPSDELLGAIAAEMNLSETAFFATDADGGLRLRWFTPRVEIDLCGHATLATAFVLMTCLEPARRAVTFQSRSGPLTVAREGDSTFVLDFPARPPSPSVADAAVTRALGSEPTALLAARDVIAVFATAAEVRALVPDMAAIARLPGVFALSVTAPGTGEDHDVDFVSRFFAPAKGVPEDPVTGSAHCSLAPYWAERLGKSTLRARQVSRRGGEMTCTVDGDRVRMAGRAVLVADGTLLL